MKRLITLFWIIYLASLPMHPHLTGEWLPLEKAGCLTTCLLAFTFLLFRPSHISLQMQDIFLFIYVIYNAIMYIFIFQIYSPFLFYQWSSGIGLYILARNRLIKLSLLLAAFSCAGCLQALIVLLQSFGYLKSINQTFTCTGSFYNPGPMGGYIGICLLFTIGLLKFKYNNIYNKRFSLFTGCIIQSLAVILSYSRATWIAVSIGLFYLFYPEIRKYFLSRTIYLYTLFPACIVGTFIGCIMLYSYKRPSANGRLLIWHVSVQMIQDAPLCGKGPLAFEKEYMLYQARHFKKKLQSAQSIIADNTNYPFNEFIGVTIRQGFLGLILKLFLLIYPIIKSVRTDETLICHTGLIFLIVFSCFSYPNSIFPLFAFIPLLTGSLLTKQLYELHIPQLQKCCDIIILLLLLACSKKILFLTKTSNHLNNLYEHHIDIGEEDYIQLKNCATFNDYYMTWLIQHNKITHSINKRCLDGFPSCENYCEIGRYYHIHKQYIQAIHYYQTAGLMIPSRVTPQYELFEIYLETGDSVNATATAQRILTQPVKIESTKTLRMKAFARDYLEKQNIKTN